LIANRFLMSSLVTDSESELATRPWRALPVTT